MAFYHKTYDVRGVQFHPESILTPTGKQMLKNWLEKTENVVQQAPEVLVSSVVEMPIETPKRNKKTLANTLAYLHEGHSLGYAEARERMTEISSGMYADEEVTEFITAYFMRDITATELTGFRDALHILALQPKLEVGDSIDLCGTGGDGKSTFNISTLASFVVAGAGYKVTKHGNYGLSSKSGSSNVLEYFGAKFTNETAVLGKQLDASNFCYMHAPLFHPALKHVGPIRKRLGVKTFFNMLGPLLNPVSPKAQFTGVYSPLVAALYRDHFAQTDNNYMVIHSHDGYDEVSLTADVLCYSNVLDGGITPEMFGTQALRPEQLVGGNSIEEAAAIFTAVLDNRATAAQKLVVLSNAALAIRCLEPQKPLVDCVALATESLESLRAKDAFARYVAI
jgi:anthranilate phosphoribosyltransferase